MNERIPRDAFGLAPGEYWTNPHRTMRDVAWTRVGDGVPAIVLGAPSTLDVDLRKTLPAIAFHCDTLAGLTDAPFHRAVIVASRVDVPGLLAAGMDVPDQPDDPRAKEPPAPGFAGEPHELELRELLDIPWQPSGWVVTMLLRGRASNRVAIELTRGALQYVDPEVEKMKAARRMRRVPLEVQPVGVARGTGDPPAEPGLVLDAGERLRIDFRLPVERVDVFEEGEVRAVVPLWLVITGSVSRGPYVRRLHLPSFEEPVNGTAGGSAELDPLAAPNFASMPPQTFFVWAFSGAAMAGPAAMERGR